MIKDLDIVESEIDEHACRRVTSRSPRYSCGSAASRGRGSQSRLSTVRYFSFTRKCQSRQSSPVSAVADGSVFQASSAEDTLTILTWKNNVEPTATPTWEMLGNGQDQSLENCLEEGFSRISQWVLPRF